MDKKITTYAEFMAEAERLDPEGFARAREAGAHVGKRPDFDRAWKMMLEDKRMNSIKRKLSIHEVRMLFYVAVEGLWGPPQAKEMNDEPPAD